MSQVRDRTKTHYLTLEKIEEYKIIQQQGYTVNPYQRNGAYWAFIESLIELGVNKLHSFLDVKDKMKETLGEKWDAFEGKESRNEHSSKDVNGRIIQNALVLQRVSGAHPYGKKLQQLGMTVNIYKGVDELPIYELKTGLVNTASPVNLFKYGPINMEVK